MTDQELLREYCECRSESAFAELLRRHVDHVYSAALRMVCDSHLAQDVTQGVFMALARSADQLSDRPVLSGWLHRTARNIAAQTVRTDVRRRVREQEAAAMNELLSNDSEADWQQLAPCLDEALAELNDADRDALLLRYFERKSAHDIGELLGLSDQTAQKRVSRALERLRESFARRGLGIGASGLAALLSANVVQAAPAGLTLTIAAAAAAGGVGVAGVTAGTCAPVVAMNWLQKAVAGAVALSSVMLPIAVQQRDNAILDQQRVRLQQQADQVAALQREQARLAEEVASRSRSKPVSNREYLELLRLRGQIGALNRDVQELRKLAEPGSALDSGDWLAASERLWSGRAAQLRAWLDSNPEMKIPELEFLTDQEWIDAVYPLNLTSEEEFRRALSLARANAELRVFAIFQSALRLYSQANEGRFPRSLRELEPYFSSPLDNIILERYTIERADQLVPQLRLGDDWVITQKAPVDQAWDLRQAIGITSGAMADATVTNRWTNVR